jgi:phosphate transport system ATP-binding protein
MTTATPDRLAPTHEESSVLETPVYEPTALEAGVYHVMETKGLRVAYSGREVLHGIDLPIARGHVTAMVGPSGCGKTTLLRTLNRLSELTPGCTVIGTVEVDGEDCLAMDPVLLRRRVGMVFQRPNLFPMSIRENVLYGVKARGGGKNGHEEILESSLRKAVIWEEVKDRLGDSALALSGGQQQRVCIARTLAVEPEVILMDEPAGSLDPVSTAKLEESLLALRGDVTVVIVTHDVPQANRVSDRLAFLYEGHVVEFGDTATLFENPQHASTRAYLAGGLVTSADDGDQMASLAASSPTAARRPRATAGPRARRFRQARKENE